MKKDSPEQFEKLELEINGEIPEYIRILSNKVVKVRAGSDWQGFRWHTITLYDAIKYIRFESNSLSGYRQIGDLGGDWRQIDFLAQLIWNNVFSRLNSKADCEKALKER